MITYSLTKYDSTEIAKFRLKVIKFHSEFGAKATLSAFLVKRSTLFLWKKKLKECRGRLTSLVPKSIRPKRSRLMATHLDMLVHIKELGEKHPCLVRRR